MIWQKVVYTRDDFVFSEYAYNSNWTSFYPVHLHVIDVALKFNKILDLHDFGLIVV